jgi:hypothetical protein
LNSNQKGKTQVIRDDLSQKLIHLTRGENDQKAANVFLSIIQERRLRGGTGCVKGGFRCVCFSEAPVSKLAHILANRPAHGMRYSPFGVMLDKSWLFSRGGRPVIYQTDGEYELLHETQKFRHVRYDPTSGVDFSWEREWRLRIDTLALDPEDTTLVVPTRTWEKWFLDRHTAMLSRRALVTQGFVGPSGVSEFSWHFIVLQDLGVEIPAVEPPQAVEPAA